MPSGPGGGRRGGSTGVPVIGGSTLGDPSKIPTSVPGNEGAWLNVGVPGQEWSRKNVQKDEHGFTTEEVLKAREELDAGGTLEGFKAPVGFTGGADKATQHANIDQVRSDYADAFAAIPKDGSATKEQRIAAAAANPAFNPEIANVLSLFSKTNLISSS